MNSHLYDSDWDYYDHDEYERSRKEQQDEYDADMADLPTCDEEYP